VIQVVSLVIHDLAPSVSTAALVEWRINPMPRNYRIAESGPDALYGHGDFQRIWQYVEFAWQFVASLSNKATLLLLLQTVT